MKFLEFMNSLNNPIGTLNPDNYEKYNRTNPTINPISQQSK